jgi:molybdopterin molybdotransferase
MLEVSAALDLVLARTSLLDPVAESLSPAVLGRVVAEDIVSDLDSPPYAKSIMDGYAIRSADAGDNVALTVVEEIAAGRVPTRIVGAGEATRVMTGAPIPDGADAVIPHEETELTGQTVRLRGGASLGQHILPRGREMKAGEVVVPAGAAITPAKFGLLAAVGRTRLHVYPSPRLAILSTGDELVEPSERPGPGQIRNSNGSMLMAQAAQAGTVSEYFGIARDEPGVLRDLAKRALDLADVLLLSGGVSAGKFDFVPDVLREIGVQAHFHKVRMKPGKPLFFGTRDRALVFGLPGNPVSSFVCFELFVRPALRKMIGQAITGPTFVPVPLAAPLKTRNDRPTYLPARLQVTAAGWRVTSAAWFGSADLRGLAGANALVRVEAGDVALPAGTAVPTLALNA